MVNFPLSRHLFCYSIQIIQCDVSSICVEEQQEGLGVGIGISEFGKKPVPLLSVHTQRFTFWEKATLQF